VNGAPLDDDRAAIADAELNTESRSAIVAVA
jgi:hypothetical protein